MILEIIAFNFQSALQAQAAGADRLELCADSKQGGTTPSFGFIQKCAEAISIPCYPMIRPRGGDFVYDEHEKDIMITDILMCKEIGCKGIVTGALLGDGNIDGDFLDEVKEVAGSMEITFHRAFDRCADAHRALQILMNKGVKRLLTSGQQNTAIEGLELITQLIKAADNRIIIMPGSAVRPTSLPKLLQTGAVEFHSSALAKPRPGAGEEVFTEMIRDMKKILN